MLSRQRSQTATHALTFTDRAQLTEQTLTSGATGAESASFGILNQHQVLPHLHLLQAAQTAITNRSSGVLQLLQHGIRLFQQRLQRMAEASTHMTFSQTATSTLNTQEHRIRWNLFFKAGQAEQSGQRFHQAKQAQQTDTTTQSILTTTASQHSALPILAESWIRSMQVRQTVQ